MRRGFMLEPFDLFLELSVMTLEIFKFLFICWTSDKRLLNFV